MADVCKEPASNAEPSHRGGVPGLCVSVQAAGEVVWGTVLYVSRPNTTASFVCTVIYIADYIWSHCSVCPEIPLYPARWD